MKQTGYWVLFQDEPLFQKKNELRTRNQMEVLQRGPSLEKRMEMMEKEVGEMKMELSEAKRKIERLEREKADKESCIESETERF